VMAGSYLRLRRDGGLVFKAHRLVYHSTLGWRVIKKKMKKMAHNLFEEEPRARAPEARLHLFPGVGFRLSGRPNYILQPRHKMRATQRLKHD